MDAWLCASCRDGCCQFEQMQNDMFGLEKDKLGLVVDVRFNAGGWLHDQVMEILSGTRHSVMQTRDGYVVSSFPDVAGRNRALCSPTQTVIQTVRSYRISIKKKG